MKSIASFHSLLTRAIVISVLALAGVVPAAWAQTGTLSAAPSLVRLETTAEGYALLGRDFGNDPRQVQVFEGTRKLDPSTVTSVTNDRIVVRSKPTGMIAHKVVVSGKSSSVLRFTHVAEATLAAVKVDPAAVAGGRPATGTVTLTGPAPKDGAAILLATPGASAVSFPDQIKIPAGQTLATFEIRTKPVAAAATVLIAARYGTSTQTTQLIVSPPVTLVALTFRSTSIQGGSVATGTATLSSPAPNGGLTVSLNSGSPEATVPATVTIPAGATSAQFQVQTRVTPTIVVADISATAVGSSPKTTQLTIQPPVISVSGLSVNPISVQGGESAIAVVTLSHPAPAGGMTVNLTSNHPQAQIIPSLSVAPGATTAEISVRTNTTGTSSTADATLSAVVGSTPARSAKLTIRPIQVSVSGLSLSSPAVQSGTSATGTVTLSAGAPDGGARIAISSSSAKAVVPATVMIQAGATSAPFTIQAGSVNDPANVTITAQGNDADRKTAALTINPLPVSVRSVTVNPSTVVGGATATATVTLSSPAPAAGASVTLSSSAPQATVPATVTVPGGSTSAQFTIQTGPPASVTTATLSAGVGSTAPKTAQMTISAVAAQDNVQQTPGSVVPMGPSPCIAQDKVEVASFTLNPATPAIGQTVTVRLKIRSKCPQGTADLRVPWEILKNSTRISSGTETLAPGASKDVTTNWTAAVGTNNFYGSVTLTDGGNNNTSNDVTVNLSQTPVGVQSLSITPQNIIGGHTLSGSITLDGTAPAGGMTVPVSSDNAAATLPSATVTIPAGQTTSTFQIVTTRVSSSTAATIRAGQNTGAKTAVLQVNPLVIESLTLNRTSVVGMPYSGEVTGTITLNGNVFSNRVKIRLSSSHPSSASFSDQPSGSSTVIPDVTNSILNNNIAGAWVPAFGNTASFRIYTGLVSAPISVTITAGPMEAEPSQGYPGARWNTTKTTTLTVNPVAVDSLTISPNLVIGGNTATATVKLNASVGTGFPIPLSSSKPSVVTVPAQAVAPTQYGVGTDTLNFTVSTLAVSASDGAEVTAGGKSAQLRVEPAAIDSLSLASPAINGGSPISGTVTLNGTAPASGLSVSLSSSDPVAMPPATVVVPSGQRSATFTINTATVGDVTPLTITATSGSVSKTANLKVLELSITQLSLSHEAMSGGNSVNGTLTLNGVAPAGGLTIPLTSSLPSAATVPAAVTVAQGSRDGTFIVTTLPVDAQRDVTITAGQGTGRKSDRLTVEPVGVTSLTINPMNVVGGGSVTGSLMLSGPAPPGGLRVPLTSSNPAAAAVPDQAAVPEGQNTVTFQITTNAVSADTLVTIIAGRGTKTKTVELSVRRQ